MTLDASDDKLVKIANFMAVSAMNNIAPVLNKAVELGYIALEESEINKDESNLEVGGAILSAKITNPDMGSISVLIPKKLAWLISSSMMGEALEIPDEIILDENRISALAEAINQCLNSSREQLISYADGQELANDALNAQIISEDKAELKNAAESLSTPKRLKFSVKLEAHTEEISIELEESLIQHLIDNFAESIPEDLLEGAAEAAVNVSQVDFMDQTEMNIPNNSDDNHNLNLLMNIKMGLTVELGRSEMDLKDILKLAKGSVIELNRLAGEPVDLFANQKLIARGEVVVIDDNFGLRVTQLAKNANLTEDVKQLTTASAAKE